MPFLTGTVHLSHFEYKTFKVRGSFKYSLPRLADSAGHLKKCSWQFLICARPIFSFLTDRTFFRYSALKVSGRLQKNKTNIVSAIFLFSWTSLSKEIPSSAFASDISARATRAYLSWCGLVFSERLRWKEMSRSGKTPATIWGEEGILSPASGSSSWWLVCVFLLWNSSVI